MYFIVVSLFFLPFFFKFYCSLFFILDRGGRDAAGVKCDICNYSFIFTVHIRTFGVTTKEVSDLSVEKNDALPDEQVLLLE